MKTASKIEEDLMSLCCEMPPGRGGLHLSYQLKNLLIAATIEYAKSMKSLGPQNNPLLREFTEDQEKPKILEFCGRVCVSARPADWRTATAMVVDSDGLLVWAKTITVRA